MTWVRHGPVVCDGLARGRHPRRPQPLRQSHDPRRATGTRARRRLDRLLLYAGVLESSRRQTQAEGLRSTGTSSDWAGQPGTATGSTDSARAAPCTDLMYPDLRSRHPLRRLSLGGALPFVLAG
eukprot:COSAG04_NODE_1261_length_7504_cov_2.488184_12_plen_124_part_00